MSQFSLTRLGKMTVFYGDYPRRGLPGGSSRGSVSHGVGLKGGVLGKVRMVAFL